MRPKLLFRIAIKLNCLYVLGSGGPRFWGKSKADLYTSYVGESLRISGLGGAAGASKAHA